MIRDQQSCDGQIGTMPPATALSLAASPTGGPKRPGKPGKAAPYDHKPLNRLYHRRRRLPLGCRLGSAPALLAATALRAVRTASDLLSHPDKHLPGSAQGRDRADRCYCNTSLVAIATGKQAMA